MPAATWPSMLRFSASPTETDARSTGTRTRRLDTSARSATVAPLARYCPGLTGAASSRPANGARRVHASSSSCTSSARAFAASSLASAWASAGLFAGDLPVRFHGVERRLHLLDARLRDLQPRGRLGAVEPGDLLPRAHGRAHREVERAHHAVGRGHHGHATDRLEDRGDLVPIRRGQRQRDRLDLGRGLGGLTPGEARSGQQQAHRGRQSAALHGTPRGIPGRKSTRPLLEFDLDPLTVIGPPGRVNGPSPLDDSTARRPPWHSRIGAVTIGFPGGFRVGRPFLSQLSFLRRGITAMATDRSHAPRVRRGDGGFRRLGRVAGTARSARPPSPPTTRSGSA